MKQSLQEILEGTVEEKIEAAEAIWNSIDENLLPVTNEEIGIMRDRYEQYLKNFPTSCTIFLRTKARLL